MRTSVGVVDGQGRAAVDGRGLVTGVGRWSLDWAVRGDDRWHVPSTEPATAVAQRLVDDAPVVETGVRVPGGQVLHRVYAAVHAGREWLVVELENRSRQPVAVALVVRGSRANPLVLPRTPSRSASSLDELLADGEGEPRGTEWALVYPLAHTAALRVAVPLVADRGRRAPAGIDLAALPDAEQVARGWRAHAEPPGAMRVELPDDRLAGALRAARAAALLRRTDADVAGLDRWGHHEVVRAELATWLHRRRLDPGAARALVDHWRFTGDDEYGADVMGVVARAADRARRDSSATALAARRAAADLLRGVGQPEAAAHVDPGPPADDAVEPPPYDTLLVLARDRLVRDAPAGTLVLADPWPVEWLGQGVEVHDAPTAHGRLSFAVRWHGARPAILWDGGGGARLTVPSLDPAWSTTAPAGEALLAPVEPAGGLPKVLAPLAERPGAGAGAADEGSFT